jgi:hypothetical protein
MRAAEVTKWSELITRGTRLDEAATELGTTVERADAYDAVLVPWDPRYREVSVELDGSDDKRVVGARVELCDPEPIRWDQLDARYGTPEEIVDSLDAPGAPLSPYYRVAPKGKPTLTVRFAVDGSRHVRWFVVRELAPIDDPEPD